MTEKNNIFDEYGNYNFPTDIKQSGVNTATTQIEDMAGDLAIASAENLDLVERKYITIEADKKYHGMGINFNAIGTAVNLYNAGYRKISDNEVVISKKTDERWTKMCDDWDNLKIDYVDKVRKETAREILTELDRTPHEYHERKIKEIAKRFGVEVEE